MMMFVAMITGVIVHKKIFTDFFTFRRKKGQRSWLDAHNSLSVLPLPYHLMITFTGIITLVGLYLPYSDKVANLPDDAYAQVFSSEPKKKDKPSVAPHLADMTAMANTAKNIWQTQNNHTISTIRITSVGNTDSTTTFESTAPKQLSKIARFVNFDSETGQMTRKMGAIPSGVDMQYGMVGLHRGRFADWWLRWLFFGLGMAGTAMVASGLVLWTVKRRTDYTKQPFVGFKLVESLNIATIAGLPVATAAFLWANRLLPAMKNRGDTEISVFFAVWAACAILALLLPKKRAWVVIFWLACGLFALLPLLSMMTTERGFVNSLLARDYLFVWMDIAFIGFAWLFWHIGIRVHTHTDKPKHAKKPPKPPPAPPQKPIQTAESGRG